MGKNGSRSPFPADYLLYLLARASHLASAEFHAELKREGVDYRTWRILASLNGGDRTVGELATIALLNQPTLSKALDRLEEADFVRRRNDKESRRRVYVSATAKGRRLAEKLIPKALAHEQKVLSHLNKNDRRIVKSLLNGLIEQLDNLARNSGAESGHTEEPETRPRTRL